MTDSELLKQYLGECEAEIRARECRYGANLTEYSSDELAALDAQIVSLTNSRHDLHLQLMRRYGQEATP